MFRYAVVASAMTNFMPFPTIGGGELIRWCSGGLAGGLHNTLSRLFSLTGVEVEAMDDFRERYFNLVGEGSTVGSEINSPPLEGQSSSGLQRDIEEPLRASVTMNNVVLFARMLPVLRDLVNNPVQEVGAQSDGGSPLTDYAKLRILSHKMCSLMEAESSVGSLVRAGNPLTCAMLDGIFSHAACGDLNHDMPDLHDFFPTNMTCSLDAATDHLQGGSSFDWQNGTIELKLFDLRGKKRVAPRSGPHAPKRRVLATANVTRTTLNLGSTQSQLIPNKLAMREFLSYLALYRSIRKLYQLNKQTISQNNSTQQQLRVSVLPGWETLEILEFDERTRKSLSTTKPNHHLILTIIQKLVRQSLKPTKLMLPRAASDILDQSKTDRNCFTRYVPQMLMS